jgi:hypothetical protein
MSGHPDRAEHQRRVLDAWARLLPGHQDQHDPTPEYLERGQRAVAEAARAGLDLGQPSQDELISLGRAARHADLTEALEQVKARNQAGRARLEAGAVPWIPEWKQRQDGARASGTDAARDPAVSSEPADDGEQVDPAPRPQPEAGVRNEKKDPIAEYLRTVPDPPDEDWS